MKFCPSTQTDYPFTANGVLIVGNAQSAALRAHWPGLGKKLILRTSYMKFSRTLFTIRNPEEELPFQGVNLCSKKILR